MTVLIDPIMEGPLDFSIPWLYEAYKNVTREWEVREKGEGKGKGGEEEKRVKIHEQNKEKKGV